MGDTPDTLGPQEKPLQHLTVFLATITLLRRRELPADCGIIRTQPDQCKAVPLVLGILAYSKDSIFAVETKLVSVNYKMTKTQLRRYRRTNSRKENSCISAMQELAISWFTENQGRAVACTGGSTGALRAPIVLACKSPWRLIVSPIPAAARENVPTPLLHRAPGSSVCPSVSSFYHSCQGEGNTERKQTGHRVPTSIFSADTWLFLKPVPITVASGNKCV